MRGGEGGVETDSNMERGRESRRQATHPLHTKNTIDTVQ